MPGTDDKPHPSETDAKPGAGAPNEKDAPKPGTAPKTSEAEAKPDNRLPTGVKGTSQTDAD